MAGHDCIVLIAADGSERQQAQAPENFNWHEYPATLMLCGLAYSYVGAVDGTPIYRRTSRLDIEASAT